MAIHIGIQLTTRCTLACDHCYQERADRDFPVELLDRVVPFAKACRCPSVGLTGGEPTLHPRFPQILARLAEEGIQVSLNTNGWDFADRFPDLPLARETLSLVSFSLDGSTEEVHDRCRKTGSFRRVLEAADLCRREEIPFAFQMTVSRKNLHDLEGTARLASRSGARHLLLIPLQPTSRLAASGILPGHSDLERIRGEAALLGLSSRFPVSLAAGWHEENPLALCPALTMRSLFVTAGGDVGFCCQLAGITGETGQGDLLGHLGGISLYEAHRRMIAAVSSLLQDKIRRFEEGRFGDADHYPCRYCMRYFGKAVGVQDRGGGQ